MTLLSHQSDRDDAALVPGTAPSRISPWLMPVVYPLGRFLVLPSYFGNIRVYGREHLPTDGPVILAPTHRARWDALMIPFAAGRHVTGRDPRFMVSADEVVGVQGWFIRRLGGFPVDTRRPSIASLRHGVELLRQGEMLVIFPEGGIYRDGEVHPHKPGLGRLAIQAHTSNPLGNLRVVPMSLHYDPSCPKWGCDVEIRIGQPLAVQDYCDRPTKEAAKDLIRDLGDRLQELDRERTQAIARPKAEASRSTGSQWPSVDSLKTVTLHAQHQFPRFERSDIQ